jgi:hypothetical protein
MHPCLIKAACVHSVFEHNAIHLQMLVDDIGDVTVTNDGATILKLLEVQHPAAKVRPADAACCVHVASVGCDGFSHSSTNIMACACCTRGDCERDHMPAAVAAAAQPGQCPRACGTPAAAVANRSMHVHQHQQAALSLHTRHKKRSNTG